MDTQSYPFAHKEQYLGMCIVPYTLTVFAVLKQASCSLFALSIGETSAAALALYAACDPWAADALRTPAGADCISAHLVGLMTFNVLFGVTLLYIRRVKPLALHILPATFKN